MDYMRITWASLTLLAELQRTTTGVDPAQSLFRLSATLAIPISTSCCPTEHPRVKGTTNIRFSIMRDTAVLGYAVNRFKDPYSAWLLRKSGFFRPRVDIAGAANFYGTIPKSRRAILRSPAEDGIAPPALFSRRRASGHAQWMEAGLDLD